MTLRDIAIAIGFKVDETKAKEAEDRISAIKDKAVSLLGAIGIGFSLAAMNEIAEEFNAINDRVRNATRELGDQRQIQERILAAAQGTRTEYGLAAKYISMMVQENREMFASVEDAAAYYEALVKMWKAAGKSSEEIEGLMEAVNKSFAKGKVDSETISQLLEQSPEAVQYLNKQLGSTTDQLEDMASEGHISLNDLKNAFLGSADEINRSFGELNYSISDGLTYIRNRWGLWLDELNTFTELTQTLARFMVRGFDMVMGGLDKLRNGLVWLADQFGGMANLLKFLALLAAALFVSFNFNKMQSGLGSILKLIGGINLKVLLIAGAVLLLFLLVEDFVNFMIGNDSMIGEALRAAGIDADEMREKIKTAWSECKDAASEFKQALDPLWEALSRFWGDWGDDILRVLGGLVAGFLDGIVAVIDIISGILMIATGNFKKTGEGQKKIWDGLLEGIVSSSKNSPFNIIFGDKIRDMWEKAEEFWERIKEIFGKIGDFFGGVGDFFGGIFDLGSGPEVDAGRSISNHTVNQSAGNGGNKTTNVQQRIEVTNNYKGIDFPTMQKANQSTTDLTNDLTDTFKFAK